MGSPTSFSVLASRCRVRRVGGLIGGGVLHPAQRAVHAVGAAGCCGSRCRRLPQLEGGERCRSGRGGSRLGWPRDRSRDRPRGRIGPRGRGSPLQIAVGPVGSGRVSRSVGGGAGACRDASLAAFTVRQGVRRAPLRRLQRPPTHTIDAADHPPDTDSRAIGPSLAGTKPLSPPRATHNAPPPGRHVGWGRRDV